jgi:geranylgeranyl diphosphate synthase type II
MRAAVDTSALLAPVPAIEAYLARLLTDLSIPENLKSAVQYAVLGNGKRLRPLLAWHFCAATGAPGEASLPAGAAAELIHTFSLVHDDLPSLDNDDLRRGKPTLHKHVGEAMAVLAGDFLLNLAYQHLAQQAPERIRGDLALFLSSATSAMVCGQVRDTTGTAQATREGLEQVHREKTGALIQAACLMGHRSGYHWWESGRRKTPQELVVIQDQQRAVKAYAGALGLIFQITDDLIDVEQSVNAAGKRTGKDAAAGKLTYPGLLGVEASRAEVMRLRGEAMKALEPLGAGAQPLRDLCEYLCVRTQ